MKVAFVTFIYPKAIHFLKKFVSSLLSQTDQNFDLLVFNDGCKNNELKEFSCFGERLKIVENTETTIALNRLSGLCFMKESNYDAFIIGDVDDQFANNRIEISKKLLCNHPFIVNELMLVNQDGGILQTQLISKEIKDSQTITFEMIKEYNLVGFSHVAFQKEMLTVLDIIFIEQETLAVDWTLFTYMLLYRQAIFTTETNTIYTMHDDNIALNKEKSLHYLFKVFDVKIQHYKNTKHLSVFHANEAINLSNFKECLVTDKKLQQKILKLISLRMFPWWSQIPKSEVLKDEFSI